MPQRNVVVFVCDQLRPDFLSAYGCHAIETPALDWITSQGVVFERAITQSTVCGPVRATMQTGRYVSDHGAWTNDVPWREGMETIGERMTAEGYRTGCFGKMHHVPALDPKGFETAAMFEEGRLGEDEPYLRWLRERHPEVESPFNHRDLKSLVSEEEHYEHWIADRALEFLESRDGRPFLAWISFQGPHKPYDPVDGMDQFVEPGRLPEAIDPDGSNDSPYVRNRAAWRVVPGDAQGRDRHRAAYAEMIAQIDRQVARVLQQLDAAGELERTTIVFTADHGDELGDNGVDTKGPWPFRSQLQVPLIVANDPRVGRGMATDALVGNIDIGSTLLDIAGAERGIGVSRSLIDQAQPAPQQPREEIFCEFMDHMKLVETRDFRLAYFPFLDRTELYDLRNDRDCRTNLAGRPEHAPVELALMRRIVDLGALCRGPRMNAFDLVPETQAGLRRMHPGFEQDIPVAFPLSAHQHQLLRAQGIDASFNEFCKEREILAHYGLYWDRTQPSSTADSRPAQPTRGDAPMRTIDTLIRPFTREDLAPVPAAWRIGPPDFVGVGCGKAGSSWWNHLLSQHPNIVQNRVGLKELHFFPHLGWKRPSPDEVELYRSAFARPTGHLCGEWSANFLYYPLALEALAEAAPDTKLVVTLRNPLDRLPSLVNQYTAFRATLVGADGDGAKILDRWSLFPEAAYQARVADGIERLLELFPREQLHVVQYERARDEPEAEFARTLDFLGLDPAWQPRDPRRPVNQQPYVIDKPDPDSRARLTEWLRRDVARTAALLPEIDLSLWPEFAACDVESVMGVGVGA